MDVFILRCNVFCYFAAFLVVWHSFLLVTKVVPGCAQEPGRWYTLWVGTARSVLWGDPHCHRGLGCIHQF